MSVIVPREVLARLPRGRLNGTFALEALEWAQGPDEAVHVVAGGLAHGQLELE